MSDGVSLMVFDVAKSGMKTLQNRVWPDVVSLVFCSLGFCWILWRADSVYVVWCGY